MSELPTYPDLIELYASLNNAGHSKSFTTTETKKGRHYITFSEKGRIVAEGYGATLLLAFKALKADRIAKTESQSIAKNSQSE